MINEIEEFGSKLSQWETGALKVREAQLAHACYGKDAEALALALVRAELASRNPVKGCSKCGGAIEAPELWPEFPELCAGCDGERVIVSNVEVDGAMHVTLPAALAAGQEVAIATKDRPVVVHASSSPSVALPPGAKPREVYLVMLDEDGTPVVARTTLDSDVLRSATVPTTKLAADFKALARTSLAMLVNDATGGLDRNPLLLTENVGAMLDNLCNNFAAGLQGRVLP